MKLGLALDFSTPRRTLAEQLDHYQPLFELGDRLGIDSVTAGEGYPMTHQDWGHTPSPLLVLAAIIPRTRMRIGTSVTLLPSWQPLKLAYDTVVLDQLSAGRLILGVGIGSPRLHERFGRDPNRIADFVDDTLAMLRALWAGENGYQGAHLSVEGGIGLRPVQPGGPELWVGGGLRRSAERAARWGNGWCASTNYGFDRIALQSRRYREALERLGKSEGEAVVSINRLAVVDRDEATARRTAATYAGRVLQRYARNGALGDDPELRSAAPEALFQLFDEDWCLAGTPAQVATRIRRYADVGVTQIQLRVSPDDIPLESVLQTVELMVTEVLPLLS